MPHRHYPPPYLRYLKARLLNLTKPGFWGTAIFLFVIGLVIREYWSNPKVLTYTENQEITARPSDNSSVSPEDQAIAADIDTLPTLFNDLKQANLLFISKIPPAKSQSKNNDKLIQKINKQQSSSTPQSNPPLNTFEDKNPFVEQAQTLLQSVPVGIASQSPSINSWEEPVFQLLGVQTIAVVNQTDNSENTNLIIDSPTLVNQSTYPSLSGLNSPKLNSQTTNQISPYKQVYSKEVWQSQPHQASPNPTFTPGIQPTIAAPNHLPRHTYNHPNGVESLKSPASPKILTPHTLPSQVLPTTIQSPSQNITVPISPVVTDNNGNLIWRSPTP